MSRVDKFELWSLRFGFASMATMLGIGIATGRLPLPYAYPAAAGVPMPASAEARPHYRGLPPVEFRGEWTGTVRFVDDVKALCGDDAYACGSELGLILPNPCTPDKIAEVGWSPSDGSMAMVRVGRRWVEEDYRSVVCHEIGHAHGWPGNHWIASETEIAQIRIEMTERLYADDQVAGGVNKTWLLTWPDYGQKGEAALARMLADGDVRVSYWGQQGETVRLVPCKYWTMRQERKGDGTKGIKKWCGDVVEK